MFLCTYSSRRIEYKIDGKCYLIGNFTEIIVRFFQYNFPIYIDYKLENNNARVLKFPPNNYNF